MSKARELPLLRAEALYIPFVGVIIQRMNNGKKEILIQTRQKSSDGVYSGTIEIPGGKLRAFEDVYETARREVLEECGLEITFIDGEKKRVDYPNTNADVSSLIEPFCVTQMQQGPFVGLIFLCEARGEPLQVTEETCNARWIDCEELKLIVNNSPERMYTAFLAPLKKYLKMC
ncbi:MAG: NUDIX domain-containing protein [Parachlamydiaceae bacterium]|nr:NUDIX domain-containing protein [Parachlamydiaceae bacterium]